MSEPSEPSEPRRGESLRTVVVALLANAGIALAKLVAAVVTGSTAMFAETVHSVADTGNEVLLLIGQRRSHRAAPGHLSRGREAYFWALLAAIGVFVVGSVVAILQGIHELFAPNEATSFVVAYVVLTVAFTLEAVSFAQASHQLKGEAAELERGVLEHVRLTSDPTTRAVFAEDAAALIGNVIAFVGIALHQVTGSVVPDAVASIAIGVVLAGVAWFLVSRNRDFLVGEEVSPAGKERIARMLEGWPGVVGLRDLVVSFTGPSEVWVVARVDIDDGLTGAEVEALVAGIERDLTSREEAITRVDVVPVGDAPPAAASGPR